MLTVSQLMIHVQNFVDQMNRLDPSNLAELERQARQAVLALGAEALQLVGQQQKGYQGSILSCTCGGRGRYHEDRTRRVLTVCGPVTMRRAYYRCEQCGRGWFPLDEQMDIRQGWSPGMRQMVALAGMQLPYEQAADMLRRLSGNQVSATAVQHLTEQAGAEAEQMIDRAALPETTPAPEGPHYVQMDGVQTPLRGRWAETKLGLVRRADGVVRYLHHLGGPEVLGQRLRRTAARMGIRQTSSVVVVGDGAAWIWNLAETRFPGATQIVDWYHAAEHVNAAAREVFGEGAAKGHAWAKRLRDRLWEDGADGALSFIAGSRYKGRQAVVALAVYIENNRTRMNYPQVRRRGLNVGSGQVESACKQVVQARLKRAGMRWSERDASRIIALRCVYLSKLWDKFWTHAA